MNIALLGYGTVGSGVYELLKKNQEGFKGKFGHIIDIKHILVKNIEKHREREGFELVRTDFNKIAEDGNIDVVIEAIGGITPAYEYILKSLNQKRHVITANKELMAVHGEALMQAARENNVHILYEASVAGAIPIIDAITNGLSGSTISELTGIVNGTTNFILTSMKKKRMSFEEALKLAQQMGYAESCPDSDIYGLDAARKLTILNAIAFGVSTHPDNMTVEGIDHITLEDILYAQQKGYEIKLLARSRKSSSKLSAVVAPFLVHKSHGLSLVNDVYNAVVVKCDAADELTFIGKGAGKLPTANAIVCNIIHILTNRLNYLASELMQHTERISEDFSHAYYIRLEIQNTVLNSKTKDVLAEAEMDQYEFKENNLFILTKQCSRQSVEDMIDKIKDFENIKKTAVIRILTEDRDE